MSDPGAAGPGARFSVLGFGNWGTALACYLGSRGYHVTAWTHDGAAADEARRTGRNPRYLSDTPLPPGVTVTADLDAACRADVIVLAVPSHVTGTFVPSLAAVGPDALFVSGVKGLDPETLLTPLGVIRRFLPHVRDVVTFAGPCFARDLAAGSPAGVVAASGSEAAAVRVAGLFSSPTMKVYHSTDPLGVELGGIVKNVIALAAGVSDGLGLGDSARAGLVTRGLAEMTRLAVAMGARARTLSGLSGLGDLVMTATCDQSRNRTVGVRLGRGEALADVVRTLGSVAEAVTTTPLVVKLARLHGVDMPVTGAVARLLAGETTPSGMVTELMSRPQRAEAD